MPSIWLHLATRKSAQYHKVHNTSSPRQPARPPPQAPQAGGVAWTACPTSSSLFFSCGRWSNNTPNSADFQIFFRSNFLPYNLVTWARAEHLFATIEHGLWVRVCDVFSNKRGRLARVCEKRGKANTSGRGSTTTTTTPTSEDTWGNPFWSNEEALQAAAIVSAALRWRK